MKIPLCKIALYGRYRCNLVTVSINDNGRVSMVIARKSGRLIAIHEKQDKCLAVLAKIGTGDTRSTLDVQGRADLRRFCSDVQDCEPGTERNVTALRASFAGILTGGVA